jgi:hypothetical protein
MENKVQQFITQFYLVPKPCRPKYDLHMNYYFCSRWPYKVRPIWRRERLAVRWRPKSVRLSVSPYFCLYVFTPKLALKGGVFTISTNRPTSGVSVVHEWVLTTYFLKSEIQPQLNFPPCLNHPKCYRKMAKDFAVRCHTCSSSNFIDLPRT